MRFSLNNDARAKNLARSLHPQLAACGHALTHSQCLGLAAKILGYRNWRDLKASLETSTMSAFDEDAPPIDVANRHKHHIAVLTEYGVSPDAAKSIIDTLRPTARAEARRALLTVQASIRDLLPCQPPQAILILEPSALLNIPGYRAWLNAQSEPDLSAPRYLPQDQQDRALIDAGYSHCGWTIPTFVIDEATAVLRAPDDDCFHVLTAALAHGAKALTINITNEIGEPAKAIPGVFRRHLALPPYTTAKFGPLEPDETTLNTQCVCLEGDGTIRYPDDLSIGLASDGRSFFARFNGLIAPLHEAIDWDIFQERTEAPAFTARIFPDDSLNKGPLKAGAVESLERSLLVLSIWQAQSSFIKRLLPEAQALARVLLSRPLYQPDFSSLRRAFVQTLLMLHQATSSELKSLSAAIHADKNLHALFEAGTTHWAAFKHDENRVRPGAAYGRITFDAFATCRQAIAAGESPKNAIAKFVLAAAARHLPPHGGYSWLSGSALSEDTKRVFADDHHLALYAPDMVHQVERYHLEHPANLPIDKTSASYLRYLYRYAALLDPFPGSPIEGTSQSTARLVALTGPAAARDPVHTRFNSRQTEFWRLIMALKPKTQRTPADAIGAWKAAFTFTVNDAATAEDFAEVVEHGPRADYSDLEGNVPHPTRDQHFQALKNCFSPLERKTSLDQWLAHWLPARVAAFDAGVALDPRTVMIGAAIH